MATELYNELFDEVTIIQEARELPGFPESIISPETMESFYSIAIQDIEGILGRPLEEIEKPATLRAADRAAFWSVVLFSKIHSGELDGMDFSIGAVKVQQMPKRDITRIWYRKLDNYMSIIRSDGGGMGITSISRNDRSYGR